MKTKVISVTVSFSCLLLFLVYACASTPSSGEGLITEIDQLIEVISKETVELLDPEEESVLAVYYFTVEGETSGISDYLINGLTTRIATVGGSGVKIVTRQALDQLLSEQAFQMSDLADREQQVQIGRQLGADLILTGFITPVTDLFKLNTQLIEVETAVVRGGFLLNFRLEEDFASRIEAGSDRVSEVVKIEEQVVTRTGVATLTTIFETFDEGRSALQLRKGEDFWGDLIDAASGKVRIEEEGPFDGSPSLAYSMGGRLSSPESLELWQDSYLIYSLDLVTSWQTGSYDGLHLSLMPVGFSFAEIALKQMEGDEEYLFFVPLLLNEAEAADYRIPFYNFYPYDQGTRIDPEKPFTVSIAVPLQENYDRYHFRTGGEIQAELFVDNVGVYETKGEEDAAILETFDDEIMRISFVPELYGASNYTDYRENDEGIWKVTPGVKDYRIELSRTEGGPAGSYLSLLAHLELAEEFRSFIEDEQSLSFIMKVRSGKRWGDFTSLNFFARSETLESVSFEMWDEINEGPYYYAEFGLSPIWSKITIPFSEIASEEGSLAEAEPPEFPSISFYVDVAGALLTDALSRGSLDIDLDLDDIILR
jgi:hypothetical protein